MKISYSKRADVLYLTISGTDNPCTYIEEPVGIIMRVDKLTQQIVGVTVHGFMRRMESNGRLDLPQIPADLCAADLLSLLQAAS